MDLVAALLRFQHQDKSRVLVDIDPVDRIHDHADPETSLSHLAPKSRESGALAGRENLEGLDRFRLQNPCSSEFESSIAAFHRLPRVTPTQFTRLFFNLLSPRCAPGNRASRASPAATRSI